MRPRERAGIVTKVHGSGQYHNPRARYWSNSIQEGGRPSREGRRFVIEEKKGWKKKKGGGGGGGGAKAKKPPKRLKKEQRRPPVVQGRASSNAGRMAKSASGGSRAG